MPQGIGRLLAIVGITAAVAVTVLLVFAFLNLGGWLVVGLIGLALVGSSFWLDLLDGDAVVDYAPGGEAVTLLARQRAQRELASPEEKQAGSRIAAGTGSRAASAPSSLPAALAPSSWPEQKVSGVGAAAASLVPVALLRSRRLKFAAGGDVVKRITIFAARRSVTGALGLLALTACAGAEEEGRERLIVFSDDVDTIDLAETDLTLPLNSPLEISLVRKRVGEGRVFENVYSFHNVKGSLRTSRVAFGHYSDNTLRSLRHQGFFEAFAADLSDPLGGVAELGPVYRFQNGDPHTEGFYAFIGEDPYFDRCFVARIGLRLVDYASVERGPDSVDTLVEAFLCGDLPKESALLEFLGKAKAVEDREAYRRKLARDPVGTI